MLMLFMFAVGLLMFAAYNYGNAFKRREKMQTYLYARNLLDECEYSIMEGGMNPFLIGVIKDVKNQNAATPEGNLYSQEYSFQLSMEESEMLVNSFNDEKVGIEMIVTYKPGDNKKKLPDDLTDSLTVGDRMNIEYRIKKTSGLGENEMEYRVLSEYYCSRDSNREQDGSWIDPSDPDWRTDGTNMKWQPFQYTGNIYTK